MGRKQVLASRTTKSAESDKSSKPERFVRWRNDSSRMIEPTVQGVTIRFWMVGVVKSCPESWSSQLEVLGFTRVGYAA